MLSYGPCEALVTLIPSAPVATGAGACPGAGESMAGGERDAVRLFAGCAGKVHSFDLARAEYKLFPLPPRICVNGLTPDGICVGLLVVSDAGGVSRLDVQRGTVTVVIPCGGLGALYVGTQTFSTSTSMIGAVYDAHARSLIVSDCYRHRLVRIRGL
jgi:hypothetical protein